jgi:FlaA1/EpsC-like NDP-sugar epimerase
VTDRYSPTGLRNRHLFASDALTLVACALTAFAVRFEGFDWIGSNLALVVPYILLSVPLRLVLLYVTGMYRRLWRHASVGELRHILVVASFAAVLSSILGLWILPVLRLTPTRLPFSVLFIDGILTCAAIGLPRLLARTMRRPQPRRRRSDPGKPVLIIGAGDTAKLVVKELLASPGLGFEPIGFVDDDVTLHRHTLLNLPIFGPLSMIKELVERHGISELIMAMPSARGDVVRMVVRAGLDCGIPTLTVPSLPELISRKNPGTSLREIQIEDLLRREPVETDMASIAALATAETVLVTGAGGSIGSELCRQLARLAPASMILVGHGENSIFDVLNELQPDYPDVRFTPVIADVRDRARMFNILARYRPRAVFHAAAHKHVPLMEENVVEAVTNNVLGTRNVVDAALEAGTEHFVFISTDKAVRPTSVMGATKRVAELIVQHAALKHDRNFVSVRFGNVLGSRGSVVPTFLRQIRSGGPVTVTHPEMQRYFMTIPEAVQLVLQAGALGRGGEVFLLDMGEPIRIVDIATDLIRLSGLIVGADIKLQFTGMRPGEKLYEEMFFSAESVIPTDHPKILRARNGILPESAVRRIETLVQATTGATSDEEFRQLLRNLVPDFHPHPVPASGDDGKNLDESSLSRRSGGASIDIERVGQFR